MCDRTKATGWGIADCRLTIADWKTRTESTDYADFADSRLRRPEKRIVLFLPCICVICEICGLSFVFNRQFFRGVRLSRKNSSTLGMASREDSASPCALPPKFSSLPEVGFLTLPCHVGTISGRPARCPA